MIKLKELLPGQSEYSQLLGVFAKKGGGTAPAPVFVPPAVAPLAQEAATQQSAVTPAEEAARKKEALKTGAKSLQIPTGVGDAAATGTVGTGTKAIPKV